MLVNDITSETDTNKPGSSIMIDVSKYFTGGIGEVTYKATQSVDATNGGAPAAAYTIGTDNLPMLVVTLKAAITSYDGTIDDGQQADRAALINLEATDEADEKMSSSVRVARNKKPVVPDGADAAAAILAFRMGQQDLKTPTTVASTWPAGTLLSCAKLNECVLDLRAQFDDDDHDSSANPIVNSLKYSGMPASGRVTVVPHATGVKITGVQSTAKADGTNTSAEAVKVTVTATDDGGLTVERFFNVIVDTQPMNGLSTVRRLPMNDDNDEDGDTDAAARGGRIVTELLSAFFADKEDQDLSYAILMPNDKGELVVTTPPNTASSAHITATLTGSGETAALNLVATSLLTDTLTVHVRATEAVTAADGDGGVGQYHDITFTVVNE